MNDIARRRWICDACGYIYDEAKGDPDSGLAPGTAFDEIPDDWQCPLCGLRKGDLRLLPDAAALPPTARAAPSRSTSERAQGGDDHVVIIGGGIAGWSVAEAIRERDGDTPILLITACEGTRYPKPALSTAFASGKRAEELAEQDALGKAAELKVSVRTQTRVLRIDPRKKRIATATGGISYGKLVLALGAQQRALPIAGDAADGVLRVNDLASYRALRGRLEAGARHVTILGAGLIGCEFAEDLCTGGYEVSVVDPHDYPLASLLPPQMGRELEGRLQAKGVEWRLLATLDSLERSGGRLRATLSSGEAIETDLVLSAAGLVANTRLAESAGLAVNRGIETDRLMRASMPDIYAIGDCAAVEGEIFAYIEPIRRQAQTIAAELRGERKPFSKRPPLVRVKTPSYPLAVCPPLLEHARRTTPRASQEAGRIDFLCDEQIVGFALSGEGAGGGMNLYRQLYG